MIYCINSEIEKTQMIYYIKEFFLSLFDVHITYLQYGIFLIRSDLSRI